MGMATCKDCLHIEVCAYCVNDLPICDSFKDRTKYEEVVHGQWRCGYDVHNGKVVYHSIYCSECQGVFEDKSIEIVEHWKSQFQICPFCGAKMDGGVDND